MSTQLALAGGDGAAPLEQWARTFRATAEVCTSLARTHFVPATLRVFHQDGSLDEGATAAQVTAAILTGQELGMQPMAALRSIDVINGSPAMRAILLRGLVLRAGHEIWVHESTATRAIVRGKRRDSTHVQESVWTMDRARAAGLVGKPNWRAMPTNQLLARATAECARIVAPDELLGMPYAVEELADGEPGQDSALVEPAEPTRKRRARRAPVAIETAELPSLDNAAPPPGPPRAVRPEGDGMGARPDGEPVVPEPGVAPPLTSAQRTAIHAALTGLRITDRDDRLAMLAGIIGRDVASTNDLTSSEAAHVIDELRLLADRAVREGDDDEPPFDDE